MPWQPYSTEWSPVAVARRTVSLCVFAAARATFGMPRDAASGLVAISRIKSVLMQRGRNKDDANAANLKTRTLSKNFFGRACVDSYQQKHSGF
jgi:hypothetical protein